MNHSLLVTLALAVVGVTFASSPAIAAEPAAEGLLAKSISYAAARQYKESHRAYLKAVSMDPDVRTKDGDDFLSAIVKLDNQLIKDIGDPYVFILRADALHNSKQFEKATLEYTKAMEIDGSVADAYVGRGITLTAQGAVESAQQDFEQAIKIEYLNDPSSDRVRSILVANASEPAKKAVAKLDLARNAALDRARSHIRAPIERPAREKLARAEARAESTEPAVAPSAATPTSARFARRCKNSVKDAATSYASVEKDISNYLAMTSKLELRNALIQTAKERLLLIIDCGPYLPGSSSAVAQATAKLAELGGTAKTKRASSPKQPANSCAGALPKLARAADAFVDFTDTPNWLRNPRAPDEYGSLCKRLKACYSLCGQSRCLETLNDRMKPEGVGEDNKTWGCE